MKTYYYIAYRKLRGQPKKYAGDGVIDANSVKEVREIVSRSRGVSQRLIKVKPYVKS